MTSLSEQLGEILTTARKRVKRSRRSLADELGQADTSLIPYERGTANPTLSKVEELASQYGLEIELVVTKWPERHLRAVDEGGVDRR